MWNRNQGVARFGIVIALLFGLFANSSFQSKDLTTSDLKADTQQPQIAKADDIGGEDLASYLIFRFLGCDPKTTNCDQSPSRALYSIDTLIATLPEPTSPPLAYVFDGHLDSIERAVESAGYVLDRFDLPWSIETRAGGSVFAPAIENPTNEIHAFERSEKNEILQATDPKDEPDAAKSKPGVLLFRGTRPPNENRLLVVFVVGETPTKGVQKGALSAALNQSAHIFATNPKSVSVDNSSAGIFRIRLLGPTYTGSVDSIVLAMGQWLSNESTWFRDKSLRPTIEITSGSATAIADGVWEPLRRAFDSAKVEFHTTIVPDSVTELLILDFLHARLGARPSEIVSLSEANTAFGRAVSSRQVGSDGILRLHYPLHISHLRTEIARERGAQQFTKLDLTNHNVPIPLEDSSNTSYLTPSYSSRTTTYDELVLATLLASVNRDGRQYIYIVGSDVQDIVFLAEEVRRFSPNTTLLTSWADLLYLHTEVNSDLRGMLVFSTYPLFSLNQLWSYNYGYSLSERARMRLQFPFDVAEAQYNATLSLLDNPQAMVEYGSPTEAGAPPLWVDVVGRNYLWPVTEYNLPRDLAPNLLRLPSAGPPKRFYNLEGWQTPPRALTLAVTVLSSLGMVVALLTIGQYSVPSRESSFLSRYVIYRIHSSARHLLVLERFEPFWWFRLFGPAPFPAVRRSLERMLYQRSLLLLFLVLYLPTIWIFYLGIYRQIWASAIHGSVEFIAIYVTIILTIVSTVAMSLIALTVLGLQIRQRRSERWFITTAIRSPVGLASFLMLASCCYVLRNYLTVSWWGLVTGTCLVCVAFLRPKIKSNGGSVGPGDSTTRLDPGYGRLVVPSGFLMLSIFIVTAVIDWSVRRAQTPPLVSWLPSYPHGIDDTFFLSFRAGDLTGSYCPMLWIGGHDQAASLG